MRYGAKVLFDEVALRIAGKDRVSLVGSNGAGKSTMLKIIAGKKWKASYDENIDYFNCKDLQLSAS